MDNSYNAELISSRRYNAQLYRLIDVTLSLYRLDDITLNIMVSIISIIAHPIVTRSHLRDRFSWLGEKASFQG